MGWHMPGLWFGAFMQQPKAPEKHEKNSGAGSGIISMLEVVESDFATGLAKEETSEADEVASYKRPKLDKR